MAKIKLICCFAVLAITLMACGQINSERTSLGKAQAEQELKLALSKESQHNVRDYKQLIIKDSSSVVSIVEPIIFNISN